MPLCRGIRSKRKNILIIEDVVSSGGGIIDAVNMMRKDGVEVKEVLCVIDRQTGGYEKLEKHGLNLTSLLTTTELEKQ